MKIINATVTNVRCTVKFLPLGISLLNTDESTQNICPTNMTYAVRNLYIFHLEIYVHYGTHTGKKLYKC